MNSSHSRNILTRLFPPPRFLEMPAVGLDISDEALRFIELKRVKGKFELGIFGEMKIPTDIIEEGYIKDKEGLIKVLKNLKKEYNLKFVKASLPEEKAYLFRTSVPPMNEADIRGALQFKIEENVPVALNSAVFDYQIIAEQSQGVQHIDVGVTVLHRKVVTSYVSVLEGAGLVPIELRTEAQAIAHAIIPPQNHDAFIIIALRETKTVLAIVADNIVQFTSTLSIGSKSIADSIKKQFDATDEEVKKIRTGKEIKGSTDMFMSLVNAASVLRDEIQKLFAYWRDHADVSGGKKIEKIIISGSDTMLGLDAFLASSINVPVEIANAWKNILSLEDNVPAISKRDSLDYIPALGLALPYD